MYLTKNFNLQEFHCKDGTKVPEKYYQNVTKLAQNLQVLRDTLKVPIRVTGSGYRTATYNKKVGGAPHSQHLTTYGADINADGYTPKQLAAKIEMLIKAGHMEEGGIGIYNNFVHYDRRGTKARWTL